jgi:two-component system OmpR family sensor kinase
VTRVGFKARLTLWHAAATTAILLVAAVSADWLLARAVFSQLDAALLVIGETEAGSALDSPAGIHLHDLDARADPASLRLTRLDKLVQIVDNRGAVLLRSATLRDSELPAPAPLVARVRRGETVLETTSWNDGEPIRLLTLPIRVAGSYPFAVQVGTSLRPSYAFLRTARVLWLVMSIAVLAAVIATGTILARSALRPVSTALQMAQQIGDAIGGRRLPHPGTDDEIGRLVSTLNAMLDRLERSISAHRRFTADAAHELRTPLSRLRSELEITLRRPRSSEEYRDAVRSGLDETVRLTGLTDALLTLARLDTDQTDWPPHAQFGVTTDALEAERHRVSTEADRRGVEVVVEASPRLEVRVPPGLLTLLVGNLLQNAVKFSPPGGRVVASVSAVRGEAVLSISDSGPGIASAHLPKIFDRFFRGDPARSADVPGFGLGLSICHAIADRYGGVIGVLPNPAGGSVFSARLPLASSSGERDGL